MSPSDTSEKALEEGIESFLAGAVVSTTNQEGDAKEEGDFQKLHYKPDWKRQVEERLHRKLKKDGLLAVLKRGLDVDAAHYDLLYRLEGKKTTFLPFNRGYMYGKGNPPNLDEQNRQIALDSLIGEAINRERRRELELYKLYASDADFKKALNESIARILNLEKTEPSA